MLSIVIPSKNEKYLQRTIDGIFDSAIGDIEIIAICGSGQRDAINRAVQIAKGKYILKCDAHTLFDYGFDKKLISVCGENTVVVPRIYALDVNNWKRYEGTGIDFFYMDWRLRHQGWPSYNVREESYGKTSELMCCQGNCFLMTKDMFLRLDGLDEKHGQWGQLGVEISCKAWLSGGRMIVHKDTWFAHWFRKHNIPYQLNSISIEKAKEYSHWLWLGNNWNKQERTLGWLIDKFDPVPSWGTVERKAVA